MNDCESECLCKFSNIYVYIGIEQTRKQTRKRNCFIVDVIVTCNKNIMENKREKSSVRNEIKQKSK